MDSKDTELEDRDGKIIERDIEDEMKTAYIDYAMREELELAKML